MTRPARVIIDLDALRHNLSRVRHYAPNSKIMAIVKADAYGHGIARVAGTLAHADAFGVACLEEARQLRAAGIRKRILLLEGPYTAEEMDDIRHFHLDMVVHHRFQIDLLENADSNAPVHVWLEVDSGMHRLGFAPSEVGNVRERLRQLGGVAAGIRFITHLACANEQDNAMTRQQADIFFDVTRPYQAEKSLANSAALLARREYCLDWVRPGLMLYGVSPINGQTAAGFGLEPVMSLESALISVKHLKRGDPVGYGASWRCPEDMPVGVVAAGYGDGYPRHARTGTPILVKGKPCVLIGNPSMDMMTVDLRVCPEARIGDHVLLWGKKLPVEATALHADTVPYELLCGVHKRLEFVEHGRQN